MSSELEKLRHETALFHLLVNSVSDYAIFALDADGRIASWNPGAEMIKGYPADEAIGSHYSLFFSADDRARGVPGRLLQQARENGRVAAEGWRVRRDGSRFWASVVLTLLRSPTGAAIGFAKVTRDMTDRHAAEEALRRRERQLVATQALAHLGSWEWDVDADRVTWTDELYRIYGLEPASFVPTFAGYLDRVHPDDRDRVRTEVERAFREGEPFEFEERIVRPTGEVRTLRSRGRAIAGADGATVQLTGACLDVTELRRAQEQAVQTAREQAARAGAEETARRLAFLVEASEVLASSLDYETTLRNVAELAAPRIVDWCAIDIVQPDGTLRRVAVAHADPARVELAQRYLELYPPARDAPTGPWRVIDTGEPEYYADIPDSMLVDAIRDARQLAMLRDLGLRSAVIVPLVGRSAALGTLSLVQAESGRGLIENDVRLAEELGRHAALAIENARLHHELGEQNQRLSEQSMELELQAQELQTQAIEREALLARLQSANDALREQTRAAEQANRAKSDFLAAMSHELRTPLNAIFGYADLMELEIQGPVTAEQRESLARIKRNQRMLLALINDVLNFAKLEAGRLEITVEAQPVQELLAELEKTVAPQLAAKSLHYRQTPCESNVHVLGDRERIEQILLNLLTNAIKFTDPAGSVEVGMTCDATTVHIRVRDTGTGIPPERLEEIFDPFVQIDRHAGQQGVGLGLAISRELAQAMGGTITATSAVGEGSAFTLSLPRARPDRRSGDVGR